MKKMRLNEVAWVLAAVAMTAGCGTGVSASSSATGGDAGPDASGVNDASTDWGDAEGHAGASSRGDVGDSGSGSKDGSGGTPDGSAASDASTGSDAASTCSDPCEACLAASSVSCSSAVSACNANATCSKSLQQLWACRCGDGGQCSSQCAQGCASHFYQSSGAAGHTLWQSCGPACPVCAFH